MISRAIVAIGLLVCASLIVAKDLDLSKDDEFLLDQYLNPSVAPIFKIYLFNFTNPEEFLAGRKAKLEVMGPYTYQETWVKDDLKWLNDQEIEFTPKKIYRFLPKLSKGPNGQNRQTDVITTVNVPLLVALHQMKYGPAVARQAIGSLVEILKQKTYQNMLVRELIWGAKHPLIKLGRDVFKNSPNRYPYEEFGLFVGKNYTDQGKIRVKSGLNGDDFTGQILKWNDKDGLGFWKEGTECDRPHGSDGFFFPPGLKKGQRVHVWNRNWCRSIPFDFMKEVTHKQTGMKLARYSPGADAFGNSIEYPENSCYCDKQKNPTCDQLPNGVFNMSACQFGAPIIFSHPHFLGGDPKLLAPFEGVKPDPALHSTYFDISNIGITMRARVSAQINIAMQKIENVPQAEGLRDLIFPLMYFVDETEGITDPNLLNRIKEINAKRS